jgi:cytochrome c oxidase cbb3-type subunit III
MSDFTDDLWGLFVAAATLVSIVACALLLWSQTTRRLPKGEKAELHGHVWDGDLAEYNNPLPGWWKWLFYITIVFSLAYLVLYPGLGKAVGKYGWTSAGEYHAEMQRAEQTYGPLYAQYAGKTLSSIASDPKALAMGERLFVNSCAQCHGADAGGSLGFPSLRDADWLYGGDPDTILASIRDGRTGVMPALGDAIGGDTGVKAMTHYVRSLSSLPHDAQLAAQAKPKFGLCAACHGAEGKGNPQMGAPNLTDAIWLHGSSEEKIAATIKDGRFSRMPAQGEFLGEAKVRVLAAYVYSLSRKP